MLVPPTGPKPAVSIERTPPGYGAPLRLVGPVPIGRPRRRRASRRRCVGGSSPARRCPDATRTSRTTAPPACPSAGRSSPPPPPRRRRPAADPQSLRRPVPQHALRAVRRRRLQHTSGPPLGPGCPWDPLAPSPQPWPSCRVSLPATLSWGYSYRCLGWLPGGHGRAAPPVAPRGRSRPGGSSPDRSLRRRPSGLCPAGLPDPGRLPWLATLRPSPPPSRTWRACPRPSAWTPMYARTCRNQACFRARVTANPWRIGIARHLRPLPAVWPIPPAPARAARSAVPLRFPGRWLRLLPP